MKSLTSTLYPRLRRSFANANEIANVINRSRTYAALRMAGKGEFTHHEKIMVLEYLGEPRERIRDYFPEVEG